MCARALVLAFFLAGLVGCTIYPHPYPHARPAYHPPTYAAAPGSSCRCACEIAQHYHHDGDHAEMSEPEPAYSPPAHPFGDRPEDWLE